MWSFCAVPDQTANARNASSSPARLVKSDVYSVTLRTANTTTPAARPLASRPRGRLAALAPGPPNSANHTLVATIAHTRTPMVMVQVSLVVNISADHAPASTHDRTRPNAHTSAAANTSPAVPHTSSASWMKYREWNTAPGETATNPAAVRLASAPRRARCPASNATVDRPNSAGTKRIANVFNPSTVELNHAR